MIILAIALTALAFASAAGIAYLATERGMDRAYDAVRGTALDNALLVGLLPAVALLIGFGAFAAWSAV